MAKKTMTAGTANYRMGQIIKEFGFGSEVYKMASEYLEERVDEKFIRRDKAGNITGIKQIKEKVKTKEVPDPKYGTVVEIEVVKEGTPNSVFGRSDIFDTFLPKVSALLKTVKEENAIDGTVKANKPVLKNLAEIYANNMRSYDVTVDDIYDVRDDVDALGDATMVAEAQALLDEREKTAAWISAAKDLVARYDEAVQKARQDRN